MISVQDGRNDLMADLTPDLTPMLDILFILLVFFILTAGAVFHSMELTLPSAVSEELDLAHQPRHILLEIRENDYAVDGAIQKSLGDLKAVLPGLLASKPDHELVVAGDRQASIERLLGVLTYLQEQGIEAANILMKKDDLQ